MRLSDAATARRLASLWIPAAGGATWLREPQLQATADDLAGNEAQLTCRSAESYRLPYGDEIPIDFPLALDRGFHRRRGSFS
jgi:hypothetical protein